MNKVSDLNLALACYNAGITPSLSIYSNVEFDMTKKDSYYNIDALTDVDRFMERTGSNEISFAFEVKLLHDDLFFDRMLKTNNRLIEILDWAREDVLDQKIISRLKQLKEQGRKIGLKVNSSAVANHTIPRTNLIDTSDHYILKGSEGAGLVGEETITQLIANVRSVSTKNIIATGGISNSADIKKMFSLGANAVGIGTMFAMSEESRIPKEVKLKLLEKAKEDLIKVNGSHRGIMFTAITEHSNDNLDKSLVKGIETGQEGHINAGNSILNITEIRPLKDIVAELVKDL